MADKIYESAADRAVNLLLDWDVGSWKAMLVTAGSFNNAHDFRDDIASELVTTGYTAGGVAIANPTRTAGVKLDCDDIAFGALTAGTVTAMVVYKSVGSAATDWLLGWFDSGFPKVLNGGTLTYTVNAAGLWTAASA